jgi:hypothetical protein
VSFELQYHICPFIWKNQKVQTNKFN